MSESEEVYMTFNKGRSGVHISSIRIMNKSDAVKFLNFYYGSDGRPKKPHMYPPNLYTVKFGVSGAEIVTQKQRVALITGKSLIKDISEEKEIDRSISDYSSFDEILNNIK